jgi:hypothetical protein
MTGTRWRLLTGTIIALAVTLTAQTPDPSPPVAFSVNGTATNVSTKTIILLVTNLGGDDFYFKPGGQPRGASFVTASGLAITKVVPLLVQFSDGSTWGDLTLLDPVIGMQGLWEMIEGRAVAREFYKGAMSAYKQGGETELVKFLTQAKNTPMNPETVPTLPNLRGLGGKYLKIQQTSGSAAAIREIQSRLDAAKGRSF